jgi:C-terminal peptidase prc
VGARAALFLLLLLTQACALPTFPTFAGVPPTVAPTAEEEAAEGGPRLRRLIFEGVCHRVRERYVYPDYNGVDWDALCGAYAPRVEAAESDAAFWALMQELVGHLDDRHTAFLSPEEAAAEDASFYEGADYVGVGIYALVPEDRDHGVVLFTLPGSPAEAVGLRAHDRILRVDGLPACCSPEGYDNLDHLLGPEGTTVTVVAQLPGEAPRNLTLRRARIEGHVPVRAERIPTARGDVGYLFIPTLWDDTVAERARGALDEMWRAGPLVGLIVDLRVNGGGAYTELYDLLALFTSGEVGTFVRRGGETDPLVVAPEPLRDSQAVPLVLLISRYTESYAEVLAAALRTGGRATLVGERTAGNVETIYPHTFKDRSRLWLAEETFALPDGSSWEGTGLAPDLRVDGRWDEITADDDPGVEAALDFLLDAGN